MAVATLVHHDSRKKLLDSALYVIRAKGYSAARIEDICEAAGLTKGSFFHHFSNKEELALAAAEYFSSFAETAFSTAPYRILPDPVDRLLGYVDYRKSILQGELPNFTCLLGTMVQETYETHPNIRAACDRFIAVHAATLEDDIAEAIASRGIRSKWTPSSLAFYTQAVIQGAFVLAKAQQSAQVAADCLDHLRRYLELLFSCSNPEEDSHPQPALHRSHGELGNTASASSRERSPLTGDPGDLGTVPLGYTFS
jgi:TetR/AcrR family transcriptional regulator, transcriptional repressor for nem operon